MAGGAETPNIAALAAIAQLGPVNRRGARCRSAREAIDPICREGITLGRLFTPQTAS